MLITAITEQKRNAGRFDIYIDDCYSFSMDYDDLMEAGIRVNDSLDDMELKEIIYKCQYKKAYDSALRFLASRCRSRQEVINKLSGSGFNGEIINAVLQRLAEYDYIDDQEFSRQWVRDRMNLKPMGRKRIVAELVNKGIDRETAENAVDNSPHDDSEAARALIEKKLRSSAAVPGDAKGYNRLYRYLLSRGIDYDTARKAINRYIEIIDNNVQ